MVVYLCGIAFHQGNWQLLKEVLDGNSLFLPSVLGKEATQGNFAETNLKFISVVGHLRSNSLFLPSVLGKEAPQLHYALGY